VLGLAFPNLHWIHLVRRDVVRQAISLVRARQTNQWYELQPWAAEALSGWDSSRPGMLAHLELSAERIATARAEAARQQPASAVRYDFEAIAQQVTWLTAEHDRWSRFFDAAGIVPFRVTYEALADRYEATIRSVLDYLQLEYDERRLLPPVLKRQSDGISETWATQFAIDRARARAARTESPA
jgi:LPS sulfotransferase NodH